MTNIEPNTEKTQLTKKEENEKYAKIWATLVLIQVGGAIFLIPPIYDKIFPYSEYLTTALIGTAVDLAALFTITALGGFIIQSLEKFITKSHQIFRTKRIRYIVYPIAILSVGVAISVIFWNFVGIKTIQIIRYINEQTTINDPILQIIFSDLVAIFPFFVYLVNYCFLIFGYLFIVYKGNKKLFLYRMNKKAEDLKV